MAGQRPLVRLQLEELLKQSERRATSMLLPVAIHHRLDLLAEAAEDVAATRAEIVGMLIADASLDADRLEQAILRYRKLAVGDVIPDEGDGHNVISIRRRGPGRPGKSESQ
ncbi:MAG: hypothetical protein ACTHNY_02095 [Solirubrobacterales bacterium]